MSRKNFIITALLINLTICITLCIVVFTDKDNNSLEPTKGNVVEEENSKVLEDEKKDDSEGEDNSGEEDSLSEENSSEIENDSNTEENSSEIEVDSKNEENSTPDEVGIILDNETSTSKKEEDTTEIVESQVQSDTPPITYIDFNGITLSNQEGTTFDNEEETTTPQRPTIAVNGTMATILQSCNIRSADNMSNSSRIGTAIQGSSYRIEPTLCSGNWIAIYLEDNTIGYVSTSFCEIH